MFKDDEGRQYATQRAALSRALLLSEPVQVTGVACVVASIGVSIEKIYKGEDAVELGGGKEDIASGLAGDGVEAVGEV